MREPLQPAARGGAAPATRWQRRRALALALALSGCGAGTSVPRVMQGRTVEGPFVSDAAYSAYARGAYLEARGQSAAAIEAYRAALAADGSSAEIWTRLGVLYCREHPDDAEDAFAEAIELAAEYAPAWSARAACRQSRGQLDPALTDALRAVQLAPDDSDANLLVARLYEAQRRLPEAKVWLLGLVLRSPEPSAHWAALVAVAEAASDPALARRARTELAAREARRERALRRTNEAEAEPSSELLDALRAQNLAHARAVASRQRVDARTLALLAAARGSPAVAVEQANIVLAADPSDPDALVAALYAAASQGDGQRFAGLLERVEHTRAPSPLAARLLGELLRWYVDDDAARAWSRAYGARPVR
jgi:predicted Zn-dependent protease